MCRYIDHHCRTKFVCLDCRVSLKGWPARIAYTRHGDIPDSTDVPTCTRCRQAMIDVGREFKAPPMRATRDWKTVEKLIRGGKRFGGCGCPPRTRVRVRRGRVLA